MDSSLFVVKFKSLDDLENVDKEKFNVLKFVEILLLEKEFVSYIGRGLFKVEYNSFVEDFKILDNLKVELDKDKLIGFKLGEIFLVEKEFVCYIGRGLSYVEIKILIVFFENSSIMGIFFFE